MTTATENYEDVTPDQVDTPKVETELTVFDPIRQKMDELRELNLKSAFDYEDPEGNKMARSHIWKLRRVKGDIADAHKKAKAKALEVCRTLDGVKRDMTAEVDEMIAVHETPIKEIERREEARLSAIQDAITAIENVNIADPFNYTRQEAQNAVDTLEGMDLTTEVFQERLDEAEELHEKKLQSMKAALSQAIDREEKEAEEARLKAQREEEERKRQEEIDRKQREIEQREAELRAKEEEALQKERERKAAEESAERARREAEERHQREIQAQKEEAERKMREAEAKAKAEQEAEAKRKADHQHKLEVEAEALKYLKSITPFEPIEVLNDIIAGAVPHVTVNY
jgi:DNA repair exonuclease SbcCD ATPase subunit